MDCYIFGAGASHSYERSRTGVRPPLAKNFFSTFANLDIAADRYVRIGNVINYVRDTRGLNPIEFGQWEENIEDFLSEIDVVLSNPKRVKQLSLGQKISYDGAYTQMIFLFASVLNEIQNGEVCENYSKLCRGLSNNDCLITFNWDTLLDRALFQTTDWQPDSGYEVPFIQVFRDGWEQPAQSSSPSPKLIKLHGSTNWLMPYFALDYRFSERRFANRHIEKSERPIYCFHQATDYYPTFGDRSRTGYHPFSYFYYPPDLPIRSDNDAEPGFVRMSFVASPDVPEYGNVRQGGAPTASMPLIIPPVRKKQYSIIGDTFDQLWTSAAEAISSCDRLFIIGYSFPITDEKAWDLLSGALDTRKDKLDITLVDPYPDDLVERLNEKLGSSIVLDVHSTTFAGFVS